MRHIILFLAFGFFCTVSVQAQQTYVRFTNPPTVQFPVTTDAYHTWIRLESFSQHMLNPASIMDGKTTTGGRSHFRTFDFEKMRDETSTILAYIVAAQVIIPKVEIHKTFKGTDGKRRVQVQYELENVQIAEFASSDDTENVALIFSKIVITYHKYNSADSNTKGGTTVFTWDLAKNVTTVK